VAWSRLETVAVDNAGRIAMLFANNRIAIYKRRSAVLLKEFSLPHGIFVTAIAFDPFGQLIVLYGKPPSWGLFIVR